jgi:hypothetical protein
VWALDAVWLPRAEARAYGFPATALDAALDLPQRAGELPLFVHPRSRRLYRREIARHGLEGTPLRVTPTASYRSVLASSPSGRAAVIKLSLGAVMGRIHRRLREDQVARALLVSHVLGTVPAEKRAAQRVDWFAEVAGVVSAERRHGWLLRTLPTALDGARGGLVPAFSLFSRRDGAEPLLAEMIRRADERPEAFVARRVLAPYVNALAFLLFEEGVEHEGHAQNVLFEVDGEGGLAGRVVVRDLGDASLNLALRAARAKPLPRLRAGALPSRSRFPYVSNAADYRVNFGRPVIQRAADTIERYGLGSFVWVLNRALESCLPGYSSRAVEHADLDLWRRATIGYLGVEPLHRPRRRGRLTGIASDEAIAYYLEHVDWDARGARAAALPRAGAEPMRIVRRARRRGGRGYRRVETDWGELYLDGATPAFFRPAF